MSWQLRLFNVMARLVAKPVMRRQKDVPGARRGFERTTKLLTRMPPHIAELPDWQGYGAWVWSSSAAQHDRQVLLWLHGGGYILGSPATHAAMVARLALQAGLRAFLPDYRLAPEHPFPAAFEDACAAWDSLITRGYAPGDIAIGGDSAGGGLALALTAHLCGQGTPPGAVIAFSPWTDLTLSGGSMTENAQAEVFFSPERAPELREMVLGGASETDPRLSPLFAKFPNCPPVLLQASQSEILLDDTLRMADRLRAQRAEVSVQTLPDAPHVWQLFCPLLPEARLALEDAATFLRRQFQTKDAD